MLLTNENYFSREAEMRYMGSTQFKNFLKCEAGALAKLRGEWDDTEKSTALMVGSYVDAHFGGSLDVFKAQNPKLFRKDGGLKEPYENADQIINRIERDRLFMAFISGGSQVIRTGQIAGVPFKIKIDSCLSGEDCERIVAEYPELGMWLWPNAGALVDLKIMKDFQPVWTVGEDGGAKLPFVEAWGYDYQAAIYQEVEGNMLPFFIAAATKEKPEPDIAVFAIPQDRIDEKLYEVEDLVPVFNKIKKGEIEPRRCEQCPYCRATKALSVVVSYRELVI